MPTSFGIFLGRLLATLMSLITCFINPFAVITASMPTAPDSFIPVLRFVVASDVHITDEEVQVEKDRLAAFINTAYDLAANSETSYKELDAICFAGDVTNSGKDSEAQKFIDICKANVRGDTQLLNILGNHDQYQGADTAQARFEAIFGTSLNQNITINGFHFVCLSYSSQKDFVADGRSKWLTQQLQEAAKEDPTKPVFVLQHPHPFGTVYGSVNWGDLDTANVYNKFSQAVVFSGHSHYPINDPRSLWQGSYTSIGTGTLSYFEMEKDLSAGQFPEGNTEAAQFRMVEVDAQGNVIVTNFDLITNSFFGEEYYLTGFDNKAGFAYTSKNRKRSDPAPVFPSGSTVTGKTTDGETVITFPAATDRYIVHDYKITVKNSFGLPVWSGSVMSHYYLNNYGSVETLNLGDIGLEAGTAYSVTVKAQNAYGNASKGISGTIS